MEEIELHHPTISELITALSKLPQEMRIVISDADTGWSVDIIHINEYGGYIELSGDYSEMNTYRSKP